MGLFKKDKPKGQGAPPSGPQKSVEQFVAGPSLNRKTTIAPAAARRAKAEGAAQLHPGQTLRVPGLGEFTVHDIKGGKGKSGMGIVYIVLDVATMAPYAVKTFQRSCLDTADLVQRFLREAETWIRLEQHPNIVRAFYVATIHDQPHVFVEYVAGSDLRRKILAGPLPVQDALRYSIMFCRGMAHAQRKVPGLVHRDVKPENCLFTPDGTLKVTDFGLVKALEQSDFSAQRVVREDAGELQSRYFKTRLGQGGVGTLPYMAPEQFTDFANVTVAADIYSFGIMLYEMLAGQRPFRAANAEEYFQQHSRTPPLDVVSLRHEIGRSLSDLVMRCIAKAPRQRYKDFAGLEHELAAILKGDYQTEVIQPAATELEAWDIVNKGAALNNLGRSKEALTYFDMALEMMPRLDAAWLNKGVALAKSGQRDQALACYKTALEINPQSADTWYNCGLAYQQEGQLEQALESYGRALALNPMAELTWLNKGVILRRLGRHKEAVECYDRVLAINAQSAVAWHNKGFALSQVSRTDDELSCYDKALALNPQFVEAWLNRGVALRKANRLIEALVCYEKALELNPKHANAWYNKGRVHVRLGQKREAQLAYDKAAALDPKIAERPKG